MNNKEFTTELANRLGQTSKETDDIIKSLLTEMTQLLQDGKVVNISSFGSLEVKKRSERIFMNTATNQRILVPPKLVLTYKPSEEHKDTSI